MKSYRKRIVILSIFSLFLSFSGFAQTEICDNGIDDDDNGFIDCYDGTCADNNDCEGFYIGSVVTCQEEPTANPAFTMQVQWSSDNQTADSFSTPIIGDLDDDGIPEVVTANWIQQKIYILSGLDGSIKNTIPVSYRVNPTLAIGKVDLSDDGCGWIFVVEMNQFYGSSDNIVEAYDCNGVLQWSETSSRSYIGAPGLADFNQDGVAELYYKNEIRDAKTGNLLIAGTGDWKDEIAYSTLGIDVLEPADGCSGNCEGLELVAGEYIYSVNITNTSGTTGNSLTVEKDIDNYLGGSNRFGFKSSIINNRSMVSAADYDLDIDNRVDVILSGTYIGKTAVFFWNVSQNEVTYYNDNGNDWKYGTGRVNLADIDGDGGMNAIFVSGTEMYALDENFEYKWSIPVAEESSGWTGCTLFDFNGDGASEIIYRSEESLLVIDGTSGAVIGTQTKTCVSRTADEYPVVADVDGDGASEICVTCLSDNGMSISDQDNTQYAQVRVYEASGEVWQPSRSVWNQHAYYNVNVNDDLTIPMIQQDHTKEFGTVDCTTGTPISNRPLNGFLNQSPYINESGCPSYVSPDIDFTGNISATASSCPETTFQVTFDITNTGDADITGTLPVTFYDGDPSLATSSKLSTVSYSLINFQMGETETITLDVEGAGGAYDLYIAVNELGQDPPFTETNGGIQECPPNDNNIKSVSVTYTPFHLTANRLEHNRKCDDDKPNNGTAEAYFEGMSSGNTGTLWLEDFEDLNEGVTNDGSGSSQWSSSADGNPDQYGVADVGSNQFSVEDGRVTWTSETIDISGYTDIAISADLSESRCEGGDWVEFWYTIDGTDVKMADEEGGFDAAHASVSGLSGGTLELRAEIYTSRTSDKIRLDNIKVTGTSPPAPVKFTEADGYQFYWYNENDFSTVLYTGSTYSTMNDGTYNVVGLAPASNCYSDTATIVIDRVEPVLNVQVYEISPLTSCGLPDGVLGAFVYTSLNGDGVPADTLTVGYTFTWTLSTEGVTPIGTGSTLTHLENTSYSVEVTSNLTGCTYAGSGGVSSSLSFPDVDDIDITITNVTTCNGTGALTADVAGPIDFNYEWYIGGSIKPTPDFTTATISGLAVGDYTVRVRDPDSDCASDPVTVAIADVSTAPKPETTVIQHNTSCDETAFNGSASADGDGAGTTSGYTFQWYSGTTTSNANKLPGTTVPTATVNGNATVLSGLPDGIYTVAVKKGGCTVTKTVEILEQSAAPSFNFITSVDAGSAINFSDKSWIEIPQAISGWTEITLSYWVYLSNENYLNDHLIFSSGGTSEDQVVLWSDNTDGLAFVVKTAGDNTNGRINTLYKPTGWTQLTGVWSLDDLDGDGIAGDMAIYADGVLLGTDNYIGNGNGLLNAGTEMYIARDRNLGVNKFEGRFDELRIYNKAFLPEEINAAVCENSDGTEEGLVIYYDFEGLTNTADGAIIPNRGTAINSETDVNTGNSGADYNGTVQLQASGSITYLTSNINCPLGYATNNTTCDTGSPNGSMDLTGKVSPLGGNYEYTLYDGYSTDTELRPAQASPLFSALPSGFYTILAEDLDNGCTTGPLSFAIANVQDLPSIVATVTNDAGCGTTGLGEILVQAYSDSEEPTGYTYELFYGATFDSLLQTEAVANGTTGFNFTGLTDGSYRVRVTNNDIFCDHYEDVIIDDSTTVPTISGIAIVNNTNCTNPDGSLNVDMPGVGTEADYTYTWFAGSTTAADTIAGETANILSGISATSPSPTGQYTVVATLILTGCQTVPQTRTITDNPTYPDVTISEVQPQSGCGAGAGAVNGIAEAGVSDGVGGTTTTGYTFTWYSDAALTTEVTTSSEDGDVSTLTDLATGTYYVVVASTTTGCSTTESVTIGNTPIEPILSLVSTSPNTGCNATSYDGEALLTATFNGSTPTLSDYDFDWYYSDGTEVTNVGQVTGADTENPTGLIDDTYRVAVTGPNGCTSDTLDVVILPDPAIAPTAAEDEPSTGCNVGNGRVIADGNGASAGGQTGFTFEWFKGANTDPSNKLPGTANANAFLVNDEPFYLGGLDPGIVYTVLVTNTTNGCSATTTATVTDATEDPLLIEVTDIVITNQSTCDPTAFGGAIDISSIIQNPQAILINNSNGSFETPDILSASNHEQSFDGGRIKTFDQTDITGWSTTASDDRIEIWHSSNGVKPTYAAYEGNQWAEINANETAALYFDLDTQPGVDMIWRFAHRGRDGADEIGLYIGPSGGTLVEETRETTGAGGWVLYEGTYTIPAGQYSTRFEYRAISTSTGNNSAGNFIDGVEFYMDPYTYEGHIADGSGTAVPDPDGDGIYENLDADTYSFTVTDNYTGCSSEIINVVVEDDRPEILAGPSNKVNNTICDPTANDPAEDDFNGGITFDPTTDAAPGAAYTFALKTSGGTAIDAAGGNGGNFSDVAYTTNGTQSVVTGLPAGNYIMNVVDDGTTCNLDYPFVIIKATVDPTLNVVDIQASTTDNTSCVPGDYTGTATVALADITGIGTALTDYEFFWATAADPTTLIDDDEILNDDISGNTGVEDGDYILIVTDLITGCTTATANITIDPGQPTLGAGESALTGNSVCDPAANDAANPDANGSVTLTPTGGAGNFAFALETSGGAAIANDGSTGGYADVAYDLNGVTTTTIEGLPEGNYVVTITDETSGCSIDHPFNIGDATVDPSILNTDLAIVPNSTCDPTAYNGSVTVEVADITDGAGAALTDYEFFWATAADPTTQIDDDEILNDDDPGNGSGVEDGDYILIVTDLINGCKTVTVNVTVGSNLPSITPTPDVLQDNFSCDASTPTGSATLTIAEGPNTDYSFEWFVGTSTAGTGFDTDDQIDNRLHGTYTVLITDNATLCTATAQVAVGEFVPSLAVIAQSSVDHSDCYPSNGEVSVTPEITFVPAGPPEGFTATFEYQWYFGTSATAGNELAEGVDPGNLSTPTNVTTNTVSGLSAGSYTVVITETETTCVSAIETVTVTDEVSPYKPTLSLTSDIIPSSCVGDNGRITAQITALGGGAPSASGGGLNFTFEWYEGAQDYASLELTGSSEALVTGDNLAANPGNTVTVSDNGDTDVGGTTTLDQVVSGLYTVVMIDQTTGCRYFETFDLGFSGQQVTTTLTLEDVDECPDNGIARVGLADNIILDVTPTLGTFLVGESFTSDGGGFGVIAADNGSGEVQLTLDGASGALATTEVITGTTSGAQATIDAIDKVGYSTGLEEYDDISQYMIYLYSGSGVPADRTAPYTYKGKVFPYTYNSATGVILDGNNNPLAGSPGAALNAGDEAEFPELPAGSYVAIAQEIDNPAFNPGADDNCWTAASIDEQILDLAYTPIIQSTSNTANTNCDVTDGNGQLSVSVIEDPDENLNGGSALPDGFRFTWFTGHNTPGGNDFFTEDDGNESYTSTVSNLDPGDYSVLIERLGLNGGTDPNGCGITRNFTVGHNPEQHQISAASITDNEDCDPLDGMIVINDGDITDDAADYEFTWYTTFIADGDGGNVLLANAFVDGGLNNGDLGANSVSGLVGGTYYVQAVHATKTCETPVFEVEVEDLRVTPAFNVAQTAQDVVCDDASFTPTGQATITITNGSAATADYSFFWFEDAAEAQPLDGSGTVTAPLFSANNSVVDQLPAGTYFVRIEDNTTPGDGCQSVQQSVTIQQFSTTISVDMDNLANFTLTPLTDCSPENGAFEIINVSESQPDGTTTDEPSTNYTFTWYEDAALTSLMGIGGSPTENVTFLNTADASVANGIQDAREVTGIPAGTYYVTIENATTGCPLAGDEAIQEFTIEDESVQPIVVVDTATVDTYCDPADPNDGNGSLTIAITEDGSTATLGEYSVEWYRGTAAGTTTDDEFIADESYADNSSSGNADAGTALVNGNILSLDGLSAGSYTVVVEKTSGTGNLGCSRTATFEVLSDPATLEVDPVAGIDFDDNYNCTSPNGFIEIVSILEDGTSISPLGHTFTWTDSNGDPVTPVNGADDDDNRIEDLEGGVYTVLITNSASGCTTSTDIEIEINDEQNNPEIQFVSKTASTLCDNAANDGTGTLEISIFEDGIAAVLSDYTLTWYRGNSTTAGNELFGGANQGTALDASGGDFTSLDSLSEGFYTLEIVKDGGTATDPNFGCTATRTFNILLDEKYPAIDIPDADIAHNTICGTGNGTITLDDSNITFNGVAGALTDYNWTITSAIGQPVADDDADLTTGIFINNLEADTVTFIAESIGTGCPSASVDVIILDHSIAPVIDSVTVVSNSDCNPGGPADGLALGSIEILGIDGAFNFGTYTYQWYVGAGTGGNPVSADFPGVTDTEYTLTGVPEGDYTVEITNNDPTANTSCTSTQTIEISNEPDLPVIASYEVNKNLSCFATGNGSVVITQVRYQGRTLSRGNADSTELLTNFELVFYAADGTTVITDSDTSTPMKQDSLTAGTYFAAIRNIASQCESQKVEIELGDNLFYPEIVITQPEADSTCTTTGTVANGLLLAIPDNASDPVHIDSAYTFEWYAVDASGNRIPGVLSTNDTLSGEYAGRYEVSVYSTSVGCTSTGQFTLTNVPEEPRILAIDSASLTACAPSNAFFEVTQISNGTLTDYTYAFYNGDPSLGNPTDSLIYQGPSPVLSFAATGFDVVPDDYYVIATSNLTGCASQIYQITLEDHSEPPMLALVDYELQLHCDPAQANGFFTVSADGSQDNTLYTFEWTDSDGNVVEANNATADSLSAGEYTVTVTSSDGCSVSEVYTMIDDALSPIPVSTTVSGNTNCIDPNGQAAATIQVPSSELLRRDKSLADYEFYWFEGDETGGVPDTSQSIFVGSLVTGLEAGLYTVYVIDSGDPFCTSEATLVEVPDDRNTPDFRVDIINNVSICYPTLPNGMATIGYTENEISRYIFEWYAGTDTISGTLIAGGDGSSPIHTVDSLAVGVYTVVATDITGCVGLSQFIIEDGTATVPVPSVNLVANRTHCTDPDGWATASVQGETEGYRFDWYEASDPGTVVFTGHEIFTLDSVTYLVEATDLETGCVSARESITILDELVDPVFEIVAKQSVCLRSDDGSVNLFNGSAKVVFDENSESGIDSIKWYAPDGSIHTESAAGQHLVDAQPGTWSVRFTAFNGCVYTADFVIPASLQVYNGLSANGDGRNDYLIIDCVEYFPNNRITIYNRDGSRVYEAEGYNNVDVRFSGLSNVGRSGLELPVGTYFYFIDKGDGSATMQGFLEIVR